jgi:MtrB/PioB family decaheme-associated outer membrane protein
MMVRYTLRAALLASTCALPLAAHAQASGEASGEAVSFSNQAEVGGFWQSQNSYKFGRFTGSVDKGGYAIGNLSVRGRDPYDSGNTRYWELEGRNLGLQSRSLYGRYGFLGSWDARIFYDGIPYYDNSTFQTIYDTSGKGTINGGIPSASVFTSDPNYRVSAAGLNNAYTLAPDLRSQLNTQGLSTKRDIVGGSFNYIINQFWSANAGLTHEHKEGTRENALMFGGATHLNTLRYCNPTGTVTGCSAPTSSSIADTFAFPQPVNYDTDRYDARLAFTAPRLQGEIGYSFFNFTDNNTSFNAIDPFPYVGAIGNLPSGIVRAAYALPPSSSEHQVRGSLGYDLTPTTRINANLSYAMQLQDAGLAAVSNNSNPGYNALDLAQLARNPSSADAREQNIFANAAIISKPMPRLDLKASYTFDDRHDMTPRNTWFYAARDATSAATPTTSLSSVLNNPLSFTSNTAKAEAGYRLLPSTKLTLGYMFQQKDTNTAFFRQSRENAGTAKLRSALMPGLEGSLAYTHSVRYEDSAWNRDLSGNQYGTIPYFEAPRTRDQVKGDLSMEASRDLFLGLNAKWTNDHYPLSVFPCTPGGGNTVCPGTPAYQVLEGSGLRNSHDILVGPDLTFTPGKNLATHFFYTYQRIFRDNRSVDTINPLLATSVGSTPYYKNQVTDETHTVGVSSDLQVTPKLKVGANYNFSYGDTTYNIFDGNTAGYFLTSGANLNFAILPLPDNKSQLHSISLHGEYQFQPNMSLWVGYQFERFIYNDVAYTIPATGFDFGNALTPGEINPSYSIHVIGAAVRVKW